MKKAWLRLLLNHNHAANWHFFLCDQRTEDWQDVAVSHRFQFCYQYCSENPETLVRSISCATILTHWLRRWVTEQKVRGLNDLALLGKCSIEEKTSCTIMLKFALPLFRLFLGTMPRSSSKPMSFLSPICFLFLNFQGNPGPEGPRGLPGIVGSQVMTNHELTLRPSLCTSLVDTENLFFTSSVAGRASLEVWDHLDWKVIRWSKYFYYCSDQ